MENPDSVGHDWRVHSSVKTGHAWKCQKCDTVVAFRLSRPSPNVALYGEPGDASPIDRMTCEEILIWRTHNQ